MDMSMVSLAIGASCYGGSLWLAADIADGLKFTVTGVRGAAVAAAVVTFALIVGNVAKAILSPFFGHW